MVAPAKDVKVLSMSGAYALWSNHSGTSYAVPHVAGLAARLLELAPALHSWPEAVRAIIMATATQDVNHVSLVLTDTIDDFDGTGEVSAYEAERVAAGGEHSDHNCWGSAGSPCKARGINWGLFRSSDFNLGGNYHKDDLYFTADEATAQIVLTWMVNVSCEPLDLTCSGDPVSPMGLAMWLWEQDPVTEAWSFKDYSMVPNAADNYLFIRRAVTPGRTYRLRINYPGKVDNRLTYYGLSWMTW